jgi:hypothetical protein
MSWHRCHLELGLDVQEIGVGYADRFVSAWRRKDYAVRPSLAVTSARQRGNMRGMADEKTIAGRIKDLESTAQKARLEAMQVAAKLLATQSSELARSNSDQSGEQAVLKARYDMLVRMADDAQAQIDRLHAEQHDVKYYRS